jgi:hypothetical protein
MQLSGDGPRLGALVRMADAAEHPDVRRDCDRTISQACRQRAVAQRVKPCRPMLLTLSDRPYGLIGDREMAALLYRNGSIEWLELGPQAGYRGATTSVAIFCKGWQELMKFGMAESLQS